MQSASPGVDSAAAFVTGLNPDVTVTTQRTRITPDNARNLFEGHHLVLDGADNFPTRYAVSDACAQLGLPVVWAAVLQFDAQVSSFVPGRPESVTLRDLYPVPPRPEDVPSCAGGRCAGRAVGQVGSIMAAEAVKLICGFGDPLVGRILLIDALTQRTREVPLRPAPPVVHTRPHTHPHTAEAPMTLNELTVEDVAAILENPARPTLLDVREPAEHALGTIPGSLAVPLGEVLTWDRLDDNLPDGPVIVYCKISPRARRAAAHLIGLGHPDASLMEGGMIAWGERIDPSFPHYSCETAPMATVRYFAAAAEAAGTEQEQVGGPHAGGVLLADLRSRHGARLSWVLEVSSVLHDGQYVEDPATPLADDALLDVLPPFAGG